MHQLESASKIADDQGRALHDTVPWGRNMSLGLAQRALCHAIRFQGPLGFSRSHTGLCRSGVGRAVAIFDMEGYSNPGTNMPNFLVRTRLAAWPFRPVHIRSMACCRSCMLSAGTH